MHSPPSGTVDARAPAVLRCVKALVLFLGIAVAAPIQPAASAAGKAILLEIDGAIGPAIADYIVRELSSAAASGAGVVILRMNTPGGLDTSMREIISANNVEDARRPVTPCRRANAPTTRPRGGRRPGMTF